MAGNVRELAQLPRVCTGRVLIILFLLLDMPKFRCLCQNLKRDYRLRGHLGFRGVLGPNQLVVNKGQNLVVSHMSGIILCGSDGKIAQKTKAQNNSSKDGSNSPKIAPKNQ